MEKESIIKLLKPFDLNSYEAKSYLALLQKDNLSAVEVAKISGVPRGRVYEVLTGLHDKGLCNLLPGDAKKYRAVNPEVLQRQIGQKIKDNEEDIKDKRREFISELERRKKEFEIEIEQKKRTFESQIDRKKLELVRLKENTDETVEILNKVYKEGRDNNDPVNYIEIMKEVCQIQKRFVELSQSAKKEILVFGKRSSHGPIEEVNPHLEEETQHSLQVFKRGVRVKCVYDLWPDENDMKKLLENINIYVNAGEEARIYYDDLPLQMAIFDRRTVMFSLLDPNTLQRTSTVQIITHPAMAGGLIMLFDSIWDQSEDYESFMAKYRKKENR